MANVGRLWDFHGSHSRHFCSFVCRILIILGHSLARTRQSNLENTFSNTPFTNPEKRFLRQLGLIAGGSGITPMLQIIRHAMRHNDDIEIFLLYANQTEEDILCREELEKCRDESNGRFHLWYTLDRPPQEGWEYSTGFINEEMIYDHMPKRQMAGDTTICICGPPPMVKFACLPNLEKNGWEEENVFVY